MLAYVAFSLTRAPASIERLQADLFVPSPIAPIAPSFRLLALVGHGRGTDHDGRALSRRGAHAHSSFESFAGSRRISLRPDAEADFQLLRYAEHLLASAIGAASSRLVLSLLLRKRTVSTKARAQAARRRQRRDPLQPRNPADRARPCAPGHRGVRQGPAADLLEPAVRRNPRPAADISPASAVALDEILRVQRRAAARWTEPGRARARRCTNVTCAICPREPFLERFAERGLVVEVRANRMPDGGIVTTFTDITPSVEAAEALERANETLERRVRERTAELTRLNAELGRAKGDAEEANISKTRFLAAASHDILQPLNAARLYVTSLVERRGRPRRRPAGQQHRCLARSGRGDSRRAARHFAARHRRHEAGNRFVPHRRAAAPARGRVRAAGARKGP